MAVSVPSLYRLRLASYAQQLGFAKPIRASDLLLVLRNSTHQYAAAALRPVLEGAWRNGITTTAATGGALEVVLRSLGQLHPARDTLHYVLDGIDIDWKIEVWNAARTVSLASATGTIGGVRADASGTIALASLGLDVLVEAQLKLSSATTPGTLYGVRVLEEIAAAADLPT